MLILLTDGENNAGEVDPVQAAELAKKMGIKIYTIGVGTRGSAPMPVRNPFTGQQDVQWVEVSIDEDTLTKIADDDRRQILPRDRHRVARRDLSRDRPAREDQHRSRGISSTTASWRSRRRTSAAWSVPPLVLLALGLLAARVLLSNTVFREFA